MSAPDFAVVRLLLELFGPTGATPGSDPAQWTIRGRRLSSAEIAMYYRAGAAEYHAIDVCVVMELLGLAAEADDAGLAREAAIARAVISDIETAGAAE